VGATRNLYDVLEVDAGASTTELRAAYRRKLRSTHPDVGGDAESFREVLAAWERLGTPEARRSYDHAMAVLAYRDAADAVGAGSSSR
jgi:curved DNA-binding protein CbpA